MESKIKWQSKMNFTAENRGIKTSMDASDNFGGENNGATPKELLLDAVMACSGMDVISMLTKMRQTPISFEVKAHADQTEGHPAYFPRIDLKYYLEGLIDAEKVLKSVNSSMTKYCGVSFMVSKGVPIFYEVYLNSQKIGDGQAFPV
jgi:putative redox protein